MANASPRATPIEKRSIAQLEQQLSDIDAELSQLAQYSPRGGTGSISYRSENHWDPNNTEWVQINLEKETPIDLIVLVPAIWRDTQTGFCSDGFPVQFEIRAGTQPESEGTVVARFDEHDHLVPRIAPLIVPCPATTASWVRVETTRLSQRAFDDKFDFKLAELLIFNGTENVAMNGKATSSHTRNPSQRERKGRFLDDGLLPYLMDAAHGEQSIAVISDHSESKPPAITIDLEAPHAMNRIHLHAVDPSDILPLAFTGDLGIPGLLRIEGANQADFSDATLLLNHRHRNAYDAGPILMLPFPETTCRYIRLTQLKPYNDQAHGINRPQMGFAEIELFSEGRNVALHKPVRINFEQTNPSRTRAALTDGRNFYGDILPLRTWMEQLARRHDLERERPLINAQLMARYARQQIRVIRLQWLAALLAAGIGATLLIDRIMRMRKISQIKERLAADLHDELGANIHSISMLSDIAQDADSPEEWTQLHQRIHQLTQRTTAGIRHCTNMLEAENLYMNLGEDMRQTAKRITTNLEHDFTLTGETHLRTPTLRTRADLFLFYKECLINSCRHSDATKITTTLTADSHSIQLSVTDNGHGLFKDIPASLQRRARLLRAQISATHPPEGGTCITLTLRLRGLRRRKLKTKKQETLNCELDTRHP